jgi:hypothetical protein
MAGWALRGKTFENAVEVARFAALLGVQPDQREPRAQVIEVFIDGLCQRGYRNCRSQHHRYQQRRKCASA